MLLSMCILRTVSIPLVITLLYLIPNAANGTRASPKDSYLKKFHQLWLLTRGALSVASP